MSPNLRRALHRALDIICDALEDEAREEKPKRKRALSKPLEPLPLESLSPDVRAQVERAAKRDGRSFVPKP